MNNSAVNFTTDDASANITIPSFDQIDILEFNILAFSFLFGFPTNAYVIWLIVTGAGSGVESDFFLLNCSVCGLFYSVNSLIDFFTKLFLLESFLALTQFLLGVAITGFPLFQLVICVERYLAVVHPVTFLKLKSLRHRVICCIVIWIITLGSCTICMVTCLIFIFYIYLWFLFLQFLLFLSIMLFCCVAVLRALKQSGPGERKEENNVKRRAFYLILITAVNTVIIYVPLTLSVLLLIVTEHVSYVLCSVTNICIALAGFVPSVLYFHRVGKLSCLSTCNIST